MVRGDDRGQAPFQGPFAQRGIARAAGAGLEVAGWADGGSEGGVGDGLLFAQC